MLLFRFLRLGVNIVLPPTPFASPQPDHGELTVTLEVGATFPGISPSEESMRAALSELSRDDALFFCARVNALISGFDGATDRLDRQRKALALLHLPKEAAAIDAFIARNRMQKPPAIFFRGQLLELARWVGEHCGNRPDEPHTFEKKSVRSAFLRAALIATELWSRRIYAKRLSDEGDSELQLRRALGAFRKGTEEGNEAPHPGMALGRGWLLFSTHMRARLPDFDALFTAATGLTLSQYYACAFAMMKETFAGKAEPGIFRTVGYGAATGIPELVDRFVRLKSQTPGELARALQKPGGVTGYKSLREHPILNFSGNRSAILDPVLYFDTLTTSPLFAVIRQAGKARQNEIFGAFGIAFEDYANAFLDSMYPTGTGLLALRVARNVKGKTTRGQEFEVDGIVNDVTSAVVFEMKSSWVVEDKILTEDHTVFLQHVRDLYGVPSTPGERLKGVAQLAKVIGAMVRGEWQGEQGEYSLLETIYPVLLVHDERMAAAGTGRFLDEEFRRVLGVTAGKIHVHPLIVMTIADLENLATSIEGFSLREFLKAYSAAHSDRMQSVHNFMATSPEFAGRNRPSKDVMEATFALGERIKAELFPADTKPDG